MNGEGDATKNDDSQAGSKASLRSFWPVYVPGLIEPFAPSIADSLADEGGWLRSNPRAHLAAWAMFAVGFLTPFFWPGIRTVYSESLWFMMVVTISTFLSGLLAVPLWLGYVIGDLLKSARDFSLGALGGRLVAYCLLAILIWRIPLLARQIAGRDATSQAPSLRASLTYPVICAALVFLWCQAVIVLIRPVFVWAGSSPTTAAIAPVQQQWLWLVVTAGIAAMVRVLLEDRLTREGHADLAPKRRGTIWDKMPPALRIVLAALLLAFLLGGTLTNWWDALAVVAAFAVLGALRAGLLGTWLAQRLQQLNYVPVPLRLLAAIAAGFGASVLFARLLWSTGSMRPIMWGAVFTAAAFYLIFPPVQEETQ